MRWIAALVPRLWWLVLPLVIGGVAELSLLHPAASGSSSGLSFVPSNLPAVQNELQGDRVFGFPLIARVAIVQWNPNGFSAVDQARAVQRATQLNLQQLPGFQSIVAAVPISNTLNVFPSSKQNGTTIVTYLLFNPSVGPEDQVQLAHQYIQRYLNQPADHTIGVTGPIALRLKTGDIILSQINILEIASVILVVVIIGLGFRSLIAPLIVLASAGLSLLVSSPVIVWLGRLPGVSTPDELRPLMTVLIFGVTADYGIFYLSSFRTAIRSGSTRSEGVVRMARTVTPIVVVAAMTIAATSLAVLLATLAVFRSVGPGMAASVLIAGFMAALVIPALIAMLGRFAFWPRGLSVSRPSTLRPAIEGNRAISLVTRFALSKVGRFVLPVLIVAALVPGVLALRSFRIGIDLISNLPSSSEPVRAADAAAKGFAPGIISPTVAMVQGQGLGTNAAGLDRLQAEFAHEPGVAGVLGPGTFAFGQTSGLFVSNSGNAARFVLILQPSPYSSSATSIIGSMESGSEDLLRNAGIQNGSMSLAGDTAISREITTRADTDLLRVSGGIVLVDALILALYLRAVGSPLLLVLSGALAVGAALGLTTWVFEHWLGYQGLTYYVPFGVVVLLAAFTTDYTLFTVGRVWESSEDHTLREAVLEANPRTAPAIGLAGIALAFTFALLFVIPLATFREVALGLSTGVLLATFVVEPILLPALLALLGPRSAWPSSRFRRLNR